MKRKFEHSGISSQHNQSGKEINFVKGKGGKVQDTHGNWYIDFCLGHGPVILGHSHEGFISRLKESLDEGIMLPSFTIVHEEYLERLFKHADEPVNAVFLKTASEAVTGAFRIAQERTGKFGIIRCGFLGWHDSQIASTPSWHQPLGSPGREQIKFTKNLRGVSGDESVFNWVDLNLDTLRELLSEHSDTVSILAIDSYQVHYAPKATWIEAVRLCHENGVMVLFDETKTGGRTSPLGIASDFDIKADLRVMGKSLANGMPMSLIVGDENHIKLARKLRIGGTFSKEVLTVRAALATLDILESCNGYQRIGAVGQRIRKAINKGISLSNTNSYVGTEQVFNGSMFNLVVKKTTKQEKILRESLKKSFSNNGVLLLDAHPSFVCLQHEEIDMDELSERSARALSQWTDENNTILNE